MSQFKCEVVKLDVIPHSNADRLAVAKIRGKAWQCVIAKDSFKTGDLAVYIPIDSVLPDPIVKLLGIEKNYHKRVRSIKLRGELSQGLVMRVPTNLATDRIEEGADLTEFLGITKWEEPIPVHMAGQLRAEPGEFVKYTDIENYKNFPDVFENGELVIITEKLHGSSLRVLNLNGEIHVGSHRRNLQYDSKNLYWRAVELLDLKNKLNPGEQVFGEIVGPGVQDLTYGKKNGEIGVYIFDFMRDGKYLDFEEFLKVTEERNLPRVPTIFYRNDIIVNPIHIWNKTLVGYADGVSYLNPDQIREGIIIKPVKEGYSEKLSGRKIIKVISDSYLLRKEGTERH